ncbi:MAG: hypothetical protein ABR572_02875 [Cryomorphaceae bacterium]|nr:hypothetical protein [Flavobacteriales bacterium]
MSQRRTLFQTAFYTVAFTGLLMLPSAAILWWAGGYTESQFGSGDAEFQHPGTYLKHAAAALAAIGTVLTIGTVAFAKKAAAGKYVLAVGCCAVVLLSLWPVSDFVMVAPRWWISAAALLGWIIFATPYTALLLMLRKQ